MKSVWHSKEEAALAKSTFEASGDWPLLIERFLFARGVPSSAALSNFFAPKLSLLKDPFSLKGMSTAIQRLVQAFERQETLCIYADFDLDGSSGLALMLDGLKSLGFKNIEFYQPLRLSEGYGFHVHAVEALKKKNVSLIVTVDVGITGFAACEKAKELGIDVIITDHHQPEEKLPVNFSLINPNQANCPSGLGYLCGAGVAFYLLRALKRGLLECGHITEEQCDLKSLLDLFTIATLTDLVPLVEDNRVLVKTGISILENTKRVGLKTLLQELGINEGITSQDVAIRMAPKLNALSRLEKGLRPVDLMIVQDPKEAQAMVTEALKSHQERVSLQAKAEKLAFEMSQAWQQSPFVFLFSKEFHKGIVGLLATKIADQTGKPAFVGAMNEENVITGSARAPKDFEVDILAALKSVESLFVKCGGHNQAAGFEITEANVPAVIEGFEIHFSRQEVRPVTRSVEYDMQLSLKEVSRGLFQWLSKLGPFGMSFPVPIFLLRGLRVSKMKSLKGGHQKLWVSDVFSRKEIEVLAFSPLKEWNLEGVASHPIDVLVEIQINKFMGSEQLQLLLKDIRPSQLQSAHLAQEIEASP